MKKNKILTPPIPSSEITPENVYINRRQFMKLAGTLAAGATLAACTPEFSLFEKTPTPSATPEGLTVGAAADELGDAVNSYEEITTYNNFYEFSTDKVAVARLARDFKASPWQVQVGGLVNKPGTYDAGDLIKKYTQEERIYRLRCVEGWSLVIPWQGFVLSDLLKEVEPQASAKYVEFITLMDPEQFPGQSSPSYPWPYSEGLRLDEAMNPLTILATGLYGKPLPPQDGAPIRLVVPWKYGFKSIKSIVSINLTETQPATLWSSIAPQEYGFYANVNPDVSHPRWTQRNERRIGEPGRRPTLKFNGYEADVAALYTGMDLNKYY
ncbi:MAG: protein-methionine-sulfoxide reductase catalytic subunit MsrP [Anaerolineaceae bacterium]